MDKDKQLISQDNALTESRYDFSRYEKNALYVVISNIRKNYIEDPNFNGVYDNMIVAITPKELGFITDKKHIKEAKEALMNLRHKDITFEKEDGSWYNTGFINWSEYDAKADVYSLEVSKKLLPYIVNLAKRFTTYDLTVAISLKSKWSQRFYEMCCQYRVQKVFHYSISELRKLFCLEEQYPKVPDFIKRVIDVAQRELKKKYDLGQCDVFFDYQKQAGTRGEHTKFNFRVHTKEAPNATRAEMEKVKDIQDKLVSIHRILSSHFKKDKNYVERVVSNLAYQPDNINPILEKLQRIVKSYKAKETPAVIRYALFADYELK